MAKGKVCAHILQVAGPIFAQQGYQATTVRKICQAAGVNVSAVNYYFGDKERLYIDAVKHARELIERRWPLPEWPVQMSAEARLKHLIHTFVHRLLAPETEGWQIQLLLREIFEPTCACEELVQEGFQPFYSNLLQILRDLTDSSVPSHELHHIGFSVISQCVFYRAHDHIVRMMIDKSEREEHFSANALAEHVYRFSRAALAAAAPDVTTRAIDS